MAAKGTHSRTQKNIDTFSSRLISMCSTSLLHEFAIPCCANCKSGRKCSTVVCKANSERTILKTERREADRSCGACVADTESHRPPRTIRQRSYFPRQAETHPIPLVTFTFSTRVMR